MKRVYFIKPIGMRGPVKIGISHAPDRRKDTLETWSPFPLEVVATIDGDLALERRFHAQFAKDSKKREWFDWSPALQDTIDAIKAGTFDIETLPDAAAMAVFRKPRDNSFYTPEWRFQASVIARFRHRGKYPYWCEDFKEIVGDDLFGGKWLAHREAIDALIAAMPAKPKKAAA